MPESAAPLTDAEIDALLSRFAVRRLGLAVSGGADSVALMLAAARWTSRHAGAPRARVLTVDHGLRPESRLEAEQVCRWAAALGLEVSLLARSGGKLLRNVQAEAREARYALLAQAAREHGLERIATAHHREDQAETLILRLARGSGLKGLAAMSEETALPDGLVLVRPFLHLPRERLIATCVAAGHPWLDDPSNADKRFARTRIRRLMPALAREGLTAERLAATAVRLARAQAAIDRQVQSVLDGAVRIDVAGFADLALGPLGDAPDEVSLRALSLVLAAIGGRRYPPRAERLERLHRGLASATDRNLSATLAGCRIIAIPGRAALVVREPARISDAPLSLRPGQSEIWDGRYRVTISPDAAFSLQVRPLGRAGWRRIRPARPIPAPARPALLSLWRGDELLAVPHAGHMPDILSATTLIVQLVPPGIPARCLRVGSCAVGSDGPQPR